MCLCPYNKSPTTRVFHSGPEFFENCDMSATYGKASVWFDGFGERSCGFFQT